MQAEIQAVAESRCHSNRTLQLPFALYLLQFNPSCHPQYRERRAHKELKLLLDQNTTQLLSSTA
jgi:hypothetical protein